MDRAAAILLAYVLVAKMVKMNEDTKKRVRRVINAGQTAFQWGFIPVILYLGRAQWIRLTQTSFHYRVFFLD